MRGDGWQEWAEEVGSGGPTSTSDNAKAYEYMVAYGRRSTPSGRSEHATIGQRLAVIEHLLGLDVVNGPADEFTEAVNDRARWFRVGVRLEGSRFVPVTSEHVHQEIVQSTLMLQSAPELVDVDAVYRKAFERALSSDPAGAVTAVEEMLRRGLDTDQQRLQPLADKARSIG